MANPLTDFARLIGRIFSFMRYAGIVFLGLVAWFIAREVLALRDLAAGVHPVLGWAVLIAAIALTIRLIGVPVLRFFRMSPVLKAPAMPARDETFTARHAEARLTYLGRYLEALRNNPLLTEHREEIALARDEARALRATEPDRETLSAFEKNRVDPLLLPLDKEADRVIRAEALSVGVATALSPNGTLDAALVLWRNANLVSRIANIYYGRPGVRGSFLILRDVSAAALLATYLEGLSEAAGGVLRGVLGSVAGVVAGPIVDGSINAIATLRVGYLAKGRCRSFKAWTDASRKEALAEAIATARDRSGEILAEIAKRAGAGLGGVGEVVKGWGASILKKIKGEDPEAATN
jgi:uncharacterized membrane protein YcjF (UPF0283 family)